MSRKTKSVTPDDVRKLLIKTVVQRSRRVLVEGLEQRLASLGIFKDGTRLDLSALPDQWEAQRERPSIDAALARWSSQGFDDAGAVDRFTREASYTWLNRLAAIRSLEVRGLIRPIASLDTASSRPSVVSNLADISPILSQAREVAEPLLWQQVFEELACELGALFDPNDPHGQMFPGSNALVQTLTIFEELSPEIWREDDTPGWFYQFFTTKDERAILRKKKGAAFTADDLGPINQFFTPSWVVRFLVDNTLGTLWRRMVPETRIADFCSLLLPATDDDTPRPRKRVRELRIIDPACGAMHFGVYAFDVLSFMYDEEGIEDRREVPRLIIEENLVGIDIDRRAIQVAALNLYLKAATALSAMGEERPANLRMNLACADAAPPAAEHVRTMRESIADPLLREAFDVAITSLKSLHAVGSLIDPEADVRAALQARSAKRTRGFSPLPGLLAQLGMVEDDHPTQVEAIVTAARELAESALRADDVPGALAAEDALLAANVLRFVSQRYDVVLMNPPYGELMPPATKTYLHQRYPKSKSDIYGAFFELAFRLAEGGGAVGALTSKTFLYLDSFRHIRSLFLNTGRMSALIDGGNGILFESTVAVAALVSWAEEPKDAANATVIRVVHSSAPQDEVGRVLSALQLGDEPPPDYYYTIALASLRKLPTQTIAYWAPPAVIRAYEEYAPLEPAYGEVRVGLQTGEDERFLRYWWELPADQIGQGKRWVPFAKGGDYSPFYENTLRVIDWENDGAAIKASSAARPQNQQYYFREGITFPNIADRFHARQLRRGSIFGHMGPSIFGAESLPLLAYLNSKVAQVLLMAQSVTRHFEVGQVRRLPVPTFDGEQLNKLTGITKSVLSVAHTWARGDELNSAFDRSWAEMSGSKDISGALTAAIHQHIEWIDFVKSQQGEASNIIGNIMQFSEADWSEIDRTFGAEMRVDENVHSVGTVKTSIDPLTTRLEQAKRVISAFARRRIMTTNIIALDVLIPAVVSDLASVFPLQDTILTLSEELGADVSVWLKRDFHAYHLQLCKDRPHLVRIAGRNGQLQAYIDVVHVTQEELRDFLVSVVATRQQDASAALRSGIAGPKRDALQEIVEDCEEVDVVVRRALTEWPQYARDARSVIPLISALAPYVARTR